MPFIIMTFMRSIVVTMVLALFPVAAFADGGAYCTGSGYMAYVSGDHVLKIVKPAPGDAIVRSAEAALKDGKPYADVYALSCGDTQVSAYYAQEICVTGIDDLETKCGPRTGQDEPQPQSFNDMAYHAGGSGSRFAVVPLAGWGGSYELHIMGYEKIDRGVQHYSMARIVKLDDTKTNLAGFYDLYGGHEYESVD